MFPPTTSPQPTPSPSEGALRGPILVTWFGHRAGSQRAAILGPRRPSGLTGRTGPDGSKQLPTWVSTVRIGGHTRHVARRHAHTPAAWMQKLAAGTRRILSSTPSFKTAIAGCAIWMISDLLLSHLPHQQTSFPRSFALSPPRWFSTPTPTFLPSAPALRSSRRSTMAPVCLPLLPSSLPSSLLVDSPQC